MLIFRGVGTLLQVNTTKLLGIAEASGGDWAAPAASILLSAFCMSGEQFVHGFCSRYFGLGYTPDIKLVYSSSVFDTSY